MADRYFQTLGVRSPDGMMVMVTDNMTQLPIAYFTDYTMAEQYCQFMNEQERKHEEARTSTEKTELNSSIAGKSDF